MFRTRSGLYRQHESNLEDSSADVILLDQVVAIKNSVLEGADVKSTNFFGTNESPNLHNQHPARKRRQTVKDSEGEKKEDKKEDLTTRTNFDLESAAFDDEEGDRKIPPMSLNLRPLGLSARPDGEKILLSDLLERLDTSNPNVSVDDRAEGAKLKDSHYQPVLPNDYVNLRIKKALAFYKNRIPLCNRSRNICQVLATCGSMIGVILAFLNLVEWTVITAIGTTGVLTWLEFQGTNNKIERYSTVVDALSQHIVWWGTRATIEKSATENIDYLIVTCETVLRDELNSWRSSSTSQAALMQKQASPNASSDTSD